MKQAEISRLTKKRLAQALKKFMTKKPLDKITVREITEDCNLNRQTFYYHFQDIYDLTTWMFQQEVLELLKNSILCAKWEEGILLLLHYIEDNAAVWNCALNTLGRINLKEIFYEEANHLINLIINEINCNLTVSEEYLTFISDFYIEAVLGLVINWIKKDIPMPADVLTHYLDVTIYGNLEGALKRAQEEHL